MILKYFRRPKYTEDQISVIVKYDEKTNRATYHKMDFSVYNGPFDTEIYTDILLTNYIPVSEEEFKTLVNKYKQQYIDEFDSLFKL